jgi:hypothetical protein
MNIATVTFEIAPVKPVISTGLSSGSCRSLIEIVFDG